MMVSPKEHIEGIRRNKYGIGSGGPNPLMSDLHQAVANLSAQLYSKDIHFVMELIQNAEDNQYSTSLKPSLHFILTSRDVTGTGTAATLLVSNNEVGFCSKNIESICSVGRSTKKNNTERAFIGNKGIGFKSVFLISSQPYIFSNGYQIRFNEEPCPYCGVGFIVPEWVEENPILSNIKEIYGHNSVMPTTTIVLPLKSDKIKHVKQQLSSIHPELLLFLSKIKQLSVKEVNKDSKSNTINSISISRETNFVTRKNIDAESYILHLCSEEKVDTQCSYYMWKQKFPVKEKNRVERRMGVQAMLITLAFPNGEPLSRRFKPPGVYAFLPTEMVTNFPFIIQADFILSSSRETILQDNKWNQGILDCVPTAFVNAFVSLVKTTDGAPLSSLAYMFNFLPVLYSSFDAFNDVRYLIKQKLLQESIVPSHSYLKERFFHIPCEVGRIMPAFWDILMKAHTQGVGLLNLASHGQYILSSYLDTEEYDLVLSFLNVQQVDDGWYVKCLKGTNIVMGVSDDVYFQILQFVAKNWGSEVHASSMRNVPLIKYVGVDGNVSLCSLKDSTVVGGRKVHLARHDHLSWLNKSNMEFRFVSNCFFMPERTQMNIKSCSSKKMLQWLRDQAKVDTISVFQFAKLLVDSLGKNAQHIISYVHFLYLSASKKYLKNEEIKDLCSAMPVIDKYGVIVKKWEVLLIPADGSKWVELLHSNPWKNYDYVELGASYICPAYFAEESITRADLIKFIRTCMGASDIPSITPPNAEISVFSSPLTAQNVLLLLRWIHSLKKKSDPIPCKVLDCIKKGCWLRTTLNGSFCYRPPSESFDLSSSCASILKNGSVLVDIPLIDHEFYGYKLKGYSEELKTIGVMFEYGEALKFIANDLKLVATLSSLSREKVFSMLKFIKFLKNQYDVESFIASIREVTWLKTRRGYSSPIGSVLYTKEWEATSFLSNIPFIDEDWYGDEIVSFKDELKLLGVVVDSQNIYQLVVDNLKPPSQLTSLGGEAFLLILNCMVGQSPACVLANTLKSVKCLKTNLGYQSPGECYLSDPSWGCILKVFTCFPVVDCDFYGNSILSFKGEMKNMGVVVDFEEAIKDFSQVFRQRAIANSLTKESGISFLSSYKHLKKSTQKFPPYLKKCIYELKWLRTRLGDHRSPKDCILYGPNWKSVSAIALLPFIDDNENYYGNHIHEYKQELEKMGVIINFEDGAHMVVAALCLPQDPMKITSRSVLSLLKCIRTMMENNHSFPDDFSRKVSREWLKTTLGYKSPQESLLFIPEEWSSCLSPTDGPFIDNKFYNFDICSYKNELKEIGVIVDLNQGCQLVSSFLSSHSEFSTIVRMYTYLSKFNWKPDTEAAKRIWIPIEDDNGKWIEPEKCVCFDKKDLFGLQLTILERYYKPDLLSFFSKAFEVRLKPSVEDYCLLWRNWEISQDRLSNDKCFKFWEYVITHFNSKTERAFIDAIAKVPAISKSDEVFLFYKRDIFIADDLQLTDLFEKMSPRPIFAWYPQTRSLSLHQTRLLEVYKKIGVRNISECVQRVEADIVDGTTLKQVNPNERSIGKGLMRLILGFLSDPAKKIEAAKRHEIVGCLLNICVLETAKPVRINYSLHLTSGEVIVANAIQWIRWERECSKLFTHTMEMTNGGHKEMIEYATYFSRAISEGVLWEYSDYICALSELIRLAFVFNFDDGAVDFIIKSKNLKIFKEDDEFLTSAFSGKSKPPIITVNTRKKRKIDEKR